MLQNLAFADLWLLWILLPLFAVWLLALALLPALGRRAPALRFSSLATLKRLSPSRSLRLRRLVEALRIVTVALLLVAMARPQTGRKLTQISTEGVDIMLVLDASGSMRALDLDADRPIARRRNRLEVAKSVVEEFIAGRESDEIGLVVFGEEAFTQCPLTLDHGVVATFLERVETGIAGDGTAIGEALGTAVKRLKDAQAKSRVAILLTDGRNNAGALAPVKAAEVARAFGVKVYTIGVGTRGKAPFLFETPLGTRVDYQNVEIDEATLEEIARITEGRSFRAEDTAALEAIYDEIDQLEKTEVTLRSYMEYDEQYRWFIYPALALLVLEVVLLGTRFRRLP